MLYPHNKETFDKAYDIMLKHGKCAVIQATGTGKTFITMEFLETLFKGMEVMYVVPTMSIAQGVEMYEDWHYNNVHFVTYAGLKKIGESPEVLILDEVHRAGATTWEKEVRRLMQSTKYTLALSATPYRFLDGKRDMAEELFGESIVHGVNIKDAIERGILNGFDYYAILGEVHEYEELLTKESVDTDVCKRILNLNLSEYNLARRIQRRVPDKFRAIQFFRNAYELEQADGDLRNWLGEDVKIFSLYSKQSAKKNREQLKAFNECEENCVIKAVDMLSEGVHVDGVNLLILTRKTESGNVFLQQLGRGLSAGKNKQRTTVIDVVQNYRNMKVIEKVLGDRIAKPSHGEGTGKRVAEIRVNEVMVTYDDVLLELEDILARIENVWTEEDDKVLKDFYGLEGSEVYRRLQGKTAADCRKRARLLGLYKNKLWSPIEDDILRNHYMEKDVFKYLPGRTQGAIERRKRVLGLVVHWSFEEDLILLKYWDTIGYDVHRYLNNKTFDDIDERVKKLNV